jgi:GTP pyrophosphokinase
MVAITTNFPAAEVFEPAHLDSWLRSLDKAYSREDLGRLTDACRLALQAYGGRQLESGELLIRHVLSVADILAQLNLDWEALAAAALSGTLDQDGLTLEILEQRFGRAVARMVDDLARIHKVTRERQPAAGHQDAKHAENLRRMILGIPRDVRVVLIVVADQLHRMRYAKGLPEEQQQAVARQTRDIYAPLANRLGIAQIKWELEDLALRYLNREQYMEIARLLDSRRDERERFIVELIGLLDEKLWANGIKAEISGRAKHIYSIWRKMQRKAVGFEQIFDVLAVRVLVDEIADCYAALGVVHGLWKHIPGEFDDYIATPKFNLYQSIHTAVIGPEGKPLEIQIRTADMHHHAELGVAAHWRYKENTKHDADFERRIVWMRHWLEMKDESATGEDFLERYRSELESALVYVFTPQGKVIELPQGATALDFAYAIHSEVGHRCRGAKVNGHIVQLTRPLQSGETVEILTAKTGGPSRDWLNPHQGYLSTSRARNRVRQWFKQQDYDRHLAAGRTSLERELARLGVTDKPDLGQVASHYNFRRGEDVLAAIGRGELSAIQVLGQLGERFRPAPKASPRKAAAKPAAGSSAIDVAGVGDLMTHLARCCKPVPRDPIVGFITRGRGVTIHRYNCPNLAKLSPQDKGRLVEVLWSDGPPEAGYPVDILVRAEDRKGLLRDVSSVFTNEDVDVVAVKTISERKTDTASMHFTVEIAGVEQLGRLMAKVSQLPGVLSVQREA